MIENQRALSVSDLLGDKNEPSTSLLAATLREMLVRVDAVCAITGLSVPTLYRLMAQGSFPRPVRITGHARAWKLSELMSWIESRERVNTDNTSLEEPK
jgi:prophage regulatory protein